jgi:hypothetical protein
MLENYRTLPKTLVQRSGMSSEVQSVLNAALALPLPQREELTAHLAQSLVGSPDLTPEEQSEVDLAWEAEIERRIADFE